MANRNYQDYLAALAKRESGGQADPYQAVNKHGYLGKYQMGKLALIDAGFYRKDGSSNNDFHDHKWTGKHGVHSREDFLNSSEAQEAAVHAYNRAQWRTIRKEKLDQFIGQKFGDGPVLTASGLLAGAHLVGVGNLEKYLESGGKVVPRDGNKVPITRYMQEMADYDVPMARARQTRTQSSQIGEIDPVVRRDGHEAQPNADMRNKAPEASRAHMVLDYALERFRTGYEYGRGDGNWATQRRNNSSPDGRTDTSRNGQDLDGDGRRGIDCSSLVYQALKGAGFKWRYSYMTTSQLFDKNGTTADAEKYFQVLSADKGRNKGYEPGDILMFRGNGKKAGQHVGIFQGYDEQGRMQFFGSQVSTGPATATIRPGGTWDGKSMHLLGALRPRAEFFKTQTQEGAALSTGKTVAEPALTTSAGKRSKAIDVTPESQSGTIIESSVHSTPAKAAPKGKQPDAIELLWNLRYKHMGADAVPDAIQSLSRKVQQACSAFDALQTARVTHYLADRAEKAQLPLQAIGEVLREAHGGRDLLHAIHQNRSHVASADINKALQAALEPALSLNPTIQPTQQVATRSSH